MFLKTNYELHVKKESNPPLWVDHGRKTPGAGLLGQRVLEKIKNGGRRFTLD